MTTSIGGASTSLEMNSVPLAWMYHSVEPYVEDPFQVTVSPQRFERQMRWLRRRGLRGVSMGELLQATDEGRARGLVGLTFDDGYQDFIPYALPVLRRYGYTATLFILAGRLGGENEWSRPGPNKPLLTADEVKQIDDAGMEIGSHGLRHISLLKADDATLAEETQRSREILGQLLGRDVAGFCYPYGYLDARIVDAARTAGYDYACAVYPGPEISRHAIPRTSVLGKDTSWRLEAKRAVSLVRVGNRFGVRHYRNRRS